MSLRFPAEQLSARSGSISAFVFENRAIQLERSLWWSVTVDFDPIDYAGSMWTCSATTDWIPWTIRTWRELDLKELRCNYGDEGIEASFYLVEHDYASQIRLRIDQNVGDRFRVEMDLVVEFSGYSGDDADPQMEVRAAAVIPFTGLVIPSSLIPKPDTANEASNVASQFVDLDSFLEPEPRAHGWLLRPRFVV